MALRIFVCAVLAIVLPLAAASSDQETWSHFLSWYKTYSGPPYPPDVMKAYAGSLRSAGKPEADIQAALGAVRKMAAESPSEMVRLVFDNIYTRHDEVFSHEPTALL